MKNLDLNQMENLQGGLKEGCSAEEKKALLLGAAIGGAIFFGWGALLTTFAAVLYNGFNCENEI